MNRHTIKKIRKEARLAHAATLEQNMNQFLRLIVQAPFRLRFRIAWAILKGVRR